jgi:hemolysin III
MIAGTYTPFTVVSLGGAWSVAMSLLIWAAALVGVAIKLLYPRRFERTTFAIYLGFGWVGLVALRPLAAVLDGPTLVLVGAGGLLYSLGTLFHLARDLKFQNAVWHGFVMAAAGVHYAAILHGVVLTQR